MSQMLPKTYLDFKIIYCLSDMQIELGILYFYLPNLTTMWWGSGPPRPGLGTHPCLPHKGSEKGPPNSLRWEGRGEEEQSVGWEGRSWLNLFLPLHGQTKDSLSVYGWVRPRISIH